jgi:hypothetical protein
MISLRIDLSVKKAALCSRFALAYSTTFEIDDIPTVSKLADM